jgi:hypothetical protein
MKITIPERLTAAGDAHRGQGRYLAQTIPNCKATFIPGAGHLWIVDHVGEVLDAAVATRGDRTE